MRQIPALLLRWGNTVIFGLLLLVELLLLMNNWGAVFFGIRAFWVLLPVTAFLAAENAVKLWRSRDSRAASPAMCWTSSA